MKSRAGGPHTLSDWTSAWTVDGVMSSCFDMGHKQFHRENCFMSLLSTVQSQEVLGSLFLFVQCIQICIFVCAHARTRNKVNMQINVYK